MVSNAAVERAQLDRARSGSRETSQGPSAFFNLLAVGSVPPTPLGSASLPETRHPAIETARTHRLAQ